MHTTYRIFPYTGNSLNEQLINIYLTVEMSLMTRCRARGRMIAGEARHICPAVHAVKYTCDWLNQPWQLGDWLSADELREQVFAWIALTEASVRLYAPPQLNGTQWRRPSAVLCVCVCFSMFGADGSDRDDTGAAPRGG